MPRALLQARPTARRAAPPVLALALALVLGGCYTQLGASETYRLPAEATSQAAAAPPAAQGARVGLNGVAEEGYVAEYGADEGYYDEDGVFVYYEDVEVTRYQPDRAYADAYHRTRSTYVSHHYYHAPYAYRPVYGYGYHDPFFYSPHFRSGFSISVGFGFGRAGFYGGSFHDPFYNPYFYDPFYAFYDPFFARPHFGYRAAYYSPAYAYGRGGYGLGYRHGYRDGFFDRGVHGWPYYAGGWHTPRDPAARRGAVRSALNPDWTRERRSALAAMTDARRVAVDAPVGTRSIRALSDDARQHVLVNRATRSAAGASPALTRAPRVPDEVERTPRVTRGAAGTAPEVTPRIGRDAPPVRVTPERTTRTPATQPERSRWDRPERAAPEAPRPGAERGTRTQPAPATRPQAEPRTAPRPAPRDATRPAPAPRSQEGTRTPPPRQETQPRPAPAPRQAEPRPAPTPRQVEPRPAPAPRQAEPPPQRTDPAPRATPPPRRETREEPPPREARTLPAPRPAPCQQERARPAPRQQENARPAPRPAPQRTQQAPPPRPAPQSAPARSTSRSDSNSGRATRSGRGGGE